MSWLCLLYHVLLCFSASYAQSTTRAWLTRMQPNATGGSSTTRRDVSPTTTDKKYTTGYETTTRKQRDSRTTTSPDLARDRNSLPLLRLTRDILNENSVGRYDTRVRPVNNHKTPIDVSIEISLYQIIEVDEPSQNIKLNVWMIQRWKDEYLYWDPKDYGGINYTVLPYDVLWIPDTYLYNSVVMARDETERYMNINVETQVSRGENASKMAFLYPAIYTVTCRLNIRYFPYDQQNCTLIISSWTHDSSALNYFSTSPSVNLKNFIKNEEWEVIGFNITRIVQKFACCEQPWVLLHASLIIRRKPLYYLVNLIIPTSIITIVAITGFFTPASTDDDRTEKINLGITTLLAMSILMLMVSDQMPTTSEFVPLIGWFYLSIIIIISIGTFLTSIVLSIQGRRVYGRCPPRFVRRLFFIHLTFLLWLDIPAPLRTLWEEMNDHPKKRRVTTNRGGRRRGNDTTRPESTAMTDRPSSRGTLRVPVSNDRSSIQMIDVSVPPSPLVNSSRTGSLWDGALGAIGQQASGPGSRVGSIFGEKPIDQMKRQRQVSLEWEFVATILDRILLIVFCFAVVIVTAGVMVVGKLAQHEYDRLLQ